MALTQCSECGSSMSDRAVACPECAAPNETSSSSSNSVHVGSPNPSGKQPDSARTGTNPPPASVSPTPTRPASLPVIGALLYVFGFLGVIGFFYQVGTDWFAQEPAGTGPWLRLQAIVGLVGCVAGIYVAYQLHRWKRKAATVFVSVVMPTVVIDFLLSAIAGGGLQVFLSTFSCLIYGLMFSIIHRNRESLDA